MRSVKNQAVHISIRSSRGSTGRFIRPSYAPRIGKELAAYKRFKELTQEWVALAVTLSQLCLDEARREADRKK